MSATVLLVEDDPFQLELTAVLLKKIGYDAQGCTDARAALTYMQGPRGPDVAAAILDIGLPGIDGLELLDLLKARYPHLPCIMLTGHQDVGMAVRAMQLGAYDYMNKPVERDRLEVVLAHAQKTTLLEKEVARLKKTQDGVLSFENLIGHDAGLASVIGMGRRAAGSDVPVLITGETGTGKEVYARAIHGESLRGGKSFVAVNCGAIPATLVESTLFGHEKGAFTGAIAKAIGKFREAEGGTIFLDEIGDLPMDAQVKLLRVLQQKEVTPVGADHSVPVNVRVVSATHQNLEAKIAAGTFREDLYFRLNVLAVHMPALRDRATDIPALTKHFIERFAASEGRTPKILGTGVEAMLMRRSWPGNVRELENAIHRAMVMADGLRLEVADFSALENGLPKPRAETPIEAPRKLSDIERDALQNALVYFGGNVTKAAQALGLAKSTFYRKLKEYGLTPS